MNEITAMLLYEKQKPVFYFFGDVCESSRPPAVADVTLESLLLLLFLLLLASSWNTERTNNNNNNEKWLFYILTAEERWIDFHHLEAFRPTTKKLLVAV